jgi:hypothetical protein
MIERRGAGRVRMGKACVLLLDGREIPALLEDLSETGALFRVDHGGAVSSDDLGCEATFLLSTVSPARRYTGEVIRMYFRQDSAYFALRFWKPYVEVT